MAKGIDLTGKKVGRLTILRLIPREERKTQKEYKARIWLCQCDCGNFVEVRGTYLIGNSNYTQESCGCLQPIKHFLKTVRVAKDSEEFLLSFADFEKVRFIHQALVRTSGNNMLQINQDFFEKFISFFYYDRQFSILYSYWQDNKNKEQTFYDWIKPSLDHKIPKSKGGSNEISNLQFLTVFENLAKRDMTWIEWEEFKSKTHTQSDLFYSSIKKIYERREGDQ